MKLVVDTNILFSFFKKDSFTQKLIVNPSLELISPEVAFKELKKYSKEISVKSKIGKDNLDFMFSLLKEYVKFVPLEVYKGEFNNSLKIIEKFPKEDLGEFLDDIDFFALASKENCPVWSKDALFKRQSIIKVFNTSELAKYFKSRRL